MKKLTILLLSALCTAATAFAYDFQSGKLYYNITSENTVAVTYQEEWSETNYQGLTTATIPETVTYDGITYSVTSIGDYAFAFCSSLTTITIPYSVTSIGYEAFEGCFSLTSITIPNSVTSIGEWAFRYCSSLTNITIPNSVTSIGDYAFYECSALTSITIPNSVTNIGSSAFAYCSSLTSIVVESDNTVYDSRDNCNAIIKTATNTLIVGCQSTTIPNSVTSIGEWAFRYCSSLTNITIPNSVTSIGGGAFYGCTSLPVVENLRYADTYLVEAVDKSLSTYTIKAGTRWISGFAFKDCSSLTSITIPNSVTSIGNSAFRGCSSLTSIVWNAKNCGGWSSYYYAPFCDICSNITSFTFGDEVETIPSGLCYGMSSLTSIAIPESVTSIGEYAFGGCSSLTSIAIPESVTSIGNSAFSRCSSLTSITIPNSVTSIGNEAFAYCSSLTSIAIPESVTSIGDYAFYECSALTSIAIPNSVTSIGNSAFSRCSSLTSIVWNAKNCGGWSSYYYAPFCDICSNITSFTFGEEVETIPSDLCYGMSSLTSIAIPESVTSIGEYAFGGCSITSITIPNSVTSIGEYAFGGCSITSITIPNSVTSIGGYAFRYCSALTSIIIGNSVEYIGERAFYYCSALADIYCYATTPPQCNEGSYGTFEGVSKHCYIHVPAGTIRDYQMAYGWSDFYHFYEISELPEGTPTDQVGVTVTGNYATFSWPVNPTASSYTLTITKDGEVFCTLIFNNMGQLVGMAFAPARDGKPSANQSDAQSTAYGFSFVVTNLNANSHYTYTFTVNGADSEVIETYSGAFDTTEEMALPTTKQDNQLSRKILRNGQVLSPL